MFCSNEGACDAKCVYRPMTPRPVQHGVGSNWSPCSTRSEPPSVLHARADYGGRLFTTKLRVVLHNLTHQMFDHLLADDAILLARQFCDRLRDRINYFISSVVSALSEPACPIPQSWSQEPVHVGGGGRNYSRADETVARSTEAHAAARSCFSVSAADTFTSVHRFKGSIPQ